MQERHPNSFCPSLPALSTKLHKSERFATHPLLNSAHCPAPLLARHFLVLLTSPHSQSALATMLAQRTSIPSSGIAAGRATPLARPARMHNKRFVVTRAEATTVGAFVCGAGGVEGRRPRWWWGHNRCLRALAL